MSETTINLDEKLVNGENNGLKDWEIIPAI